MPFGHGDRVRVAIPEVREATNGGDPDSPAEDPWTQRIVDALQGRVGTVVKDIDAARTQNVKFVGFEEKHTVVFDAEVPHWDRGGSPVLFFVFNEDELVAL